jgi:putative flippase GtrA
LALFGLVGAVSAVVDFGVYLLLIWSGVWAWAATAVSFLAAFGVNYRGNRDLVFKAGAIEGAVRRYTVLVAANWVASTGLVAVLVAGGVVDWLAKLVAMAAVAVVNFVALRGWVFRRRASGGSN